MASVNSTSTFKHSLILFLIACIFILNSIQTSHAAPDNNNNDLDTTRNKPYSNWYNQKQLLPSDPSGCMDSFRQAGVCLTDFWTNLGRPSASCCEALKKIDSSCLSALMPFLSPYIGPMLDGLCKAAGGIGAFPFPPFPFQFPGGAGAALPPPPLAH